MTMQVTSSMNSTYEHTMMHSWAAASKSQTSLNNKTSAEQQALSHDSVHNSAQNTVQKLQDEIKDTQVSLEPTEQVNNIKQHYQNAKDYDLMTSYYDQQQKLLDIYMQTSVEEALTIENENKSAVLTLTNAYTALYQLHHNIKDGIGNTPSNGERPEILPTDTQKEVTPQSLKAIEYSSNINSALSNKQLDSYNSLMMPTTANYVHLST